MQATKEIVMPVNQTQENVEEIVDDLTVIVQPDIKKNLAILVDEVKIFKEEKQRQTVKCKQDKIKTKKSQRFRKQIQQRINTSTYLTHEKILKYKQQGQGKTVNDDVKFLFNKYKDEKIAGNVKNLCELMMCDKVITVSEALQLHFMIDTTPVDDRTKTLPGIYTPVDRGLNKTYTKYSGPIDEICEIVSRTHKFDNPHHHEHMNFHGMKRGSTIELLCDYWSSAMQDNSTWLDAYNYFITWLVEDQFAPHGYRAKEQFMCLDPYEIIIFYIMINKYGITPGYCVALQSVTQRRKKPLSKEAIMADFTTAYDHRAKKTDFALMRIPEVANYFRELKIHVSQVNCLLGRFGFKQRHDFDKFQYTNLIMGAYKHYVMPKLATPTCDNCENPFCKDCSDHDFTASLQKQVVEFTKWSGQQISAAIPAEMKAVVSTAFSTFKDMTSMMVAMKDKMVEYIKPILSVLGLEGATPNFSSMVEVVKYYIIYINTNSSVVKSIAMYAILNTLGILEAMMSILFEWLGNEEEIVVEGATPTNFSDTAMKFLSRLGDHLVSMDPTRVAIVLSMIIFIICGYRLKQAQINTIGKEFAEYMRNLHFVSAGLMAFSKIFETLTAAVKFSVEWVSVHVFRRTPSDAAEKQKFEDDVKEFSEWYGKLVIFSADESLNLLMQSTILTQEAKDLVTKGYVYLKYKAEGKLDKDISIMMNNAQRMMQKIHNIITRASALTDFRPTPIHLQFFGDAGVGKSTLFKTMTDRISAKHYKNLTQRVYPMSSSSDHFDGYCGQPIVLIDDMFPANDYKDVVPLLTMISNCPMHVPMAHLEDKGMLFTSDIIFSTTNTPYPVFKDLFCKDAIWRRRHMLVKVMVDPDVKNPATGKFDLDLYKRKYPGINSYDYPHLKFTFYSPTQQDVTMDNANPVKGLSKPLTSLTFTEFMERVETKMETHFNEEKEFQNKSNMTKMRGLCDQLRDIDHVYGRIKDYSEIYENNYKVDFPVFPKKQDPTPIPEEIPEIPKVKIPMAAAISYKDAYVMQVLSYWETQCDGVTYFEDIIEHNILDSVVSCIRNPKLAFADPDKILIKWEEVREKIAKLPFHRQKDLTTESHKMYIDTMVDEIIKLMVDAPFLCHFVRAATIITVYGHLIDPPKLQVLIDHHAAIPYKFVLDENLLAPMNINLDDEATPTAAEGEEDMLARIEEYKQSITKYEDQLEALYDRLSLECINVESDNPIGLVDALSRLDLQSMTISDITHVRSFVDVTKSSNSRFLTMLHDMTTIIDSLVICRQNMMETERRMNHPRIKKYIKEEEQPVEWWRLEDKDRPNHFELVPKIKYEYMVYDNPDMKGEPVAMPIVPSGPPFVLTHQFSQSEIDAAFAGTGEEKDNPPISAIFWHWLERKDGKWFIREEFPTDPKIILPKTFEVLLNKKKYYVKVSTATVLSTYLFMRTSIQQFFRLPEEVQLRFFNQFKKWSYLMNLVRSLRNKVQNSIKSTFTSIWGSITGACKWIWNNVIKKHWKKCVTLMVGSIALIGACTAFSRLFIPKETSGREHKLFGRYAPDVPTFTSIDGMPHRVLDACCPVSVNLKTGQGFKIAPKMMLVPHHLFQNCTSDHYAFSFQTKEGIMNGFYLPKANVVRIHNSDLAIVHSEKLPQWADMRKYLRKEEDLNKEDGLYNVTLYNKAGELREVISEYGGKKVNYAVKYTNGTAYTADTVYISKTSIEVGSSGGVVLNKQPNGQHGRVIVGFQSFVLNGYSYSTGLTQETFAQFYDRISILYPTLIRPSFVDPEGTPIETSGLIDKNLMIEGTIPVEKQVFVPSKSELIPTPLLMMFPLKRIPAILSEHSKYAVGDPIRASINKYSRDPQMEPPRHITLEVVKERGAIFRHALPRRPQLLSWTQILEGNIHMPSIDTKTSPGYPWVSMPRPLPGKKTWLRFDEEGHVQYIDPLLVKTFHELDSSIRENIIPESLCIEIKKDELRPIAKALGLKPGQEYYYTEHIPISEWPEGRAPKTRSITIMDMTWILVFRKYFGDLQSMLMSQADGTNSYCIGINAESPAAANAYYSCKALNTHGFALDASNWDGHFAAWLMYRVLDLIEEIVPSTSTQERNARVCIVEYTLFSFIMYKDVCIQKMQGMISGSPGTSFFNTLGHIILADTQWKMISISNNQPQLAFLQVKDANCKDYMYGDDRITVINSKFDEIFTIDAFAKLYQEWGWPVTSATKDGFFSKQPIEELTFLKRTFIPDPENTFYIRWALDKTSIESLLQYIRKTVEPRRQLMQNVYTALDFATDWGEEYYLELVGKINDCFAKCTKLQLPLIVPNYLGMRRMKIARYFNEVDEDPRSPKKENTIWTPLVKLIPGPYDRRIKLEEFAKNLHRCIFSTPIAMNDEETSVKTQVQARKIPWTLGDLEPECDDDIVNDNGNPVDYSVPKFN